MTQRLVSAENALRCATDHRTAMDAMREFFAAKTEAQGSTKATVK
jgi:hypothetical protein